MGNVKHQCSSRSVANPGICGVPVFSQGWQNWMNSYWTINIYTIEWLCIHMQTLHMNVVKGLLDILPRISVLIGSFTSCLSPEIQVVPIFSFGSFFLLLWYQLLRVFFFFLSVFDFLLCIAFTTSHMFLVNASVNVFLMPSSSGFHVVSTQTVPCSSLPFGSNYFLTAFFIPAALPFLSLKPLKVFSFFLLCKSHTPWLLISLDITESKSTNYGWLNIIHYMWHFCRKDR